MGKTIEERAREASYANLDRLSPAFEEGYIKGATEQEEIDKQHMLLLADACEHDKALLIDKACEWLRKQEGWDALNDKPCPMFTEEDINEFRNIIKGE